MKTEEQVVIDLLLKIAKGAFVETKIEKTDFVEILQILNPSLKNNPSPIAIEIDYEAFCEKIKLRSENYAKITVSAGPISVEITTNHIYVTKDLHSTQPCFGISMWYKISKTQYGHMCGELINAKFCNWQNYKALAAPVSYTGF